MEEVRGVTAYLNIYLSSHILDNSHYNKVKNKFMENLNSNFQFVKNAYLQCKTNEERINLFKNYFEWIPVPEQILNRVQKSTDSSIYFRTQGNVEYGKKRFENALRYYNLAVNFSPTESRELALAYANRSALFVQIKEFDLALRDISNALIPSLLEDNNIAEKLRIRKIKCENEKKEDNKENYGLHGLNFNEISKPSETLIGAEGFIKMEYDDLRGRRLIATEDIPSGTLLLKDKPYVVMLEKLLTWDTEHCATCAKPILGGIPDPHSSFPSYCSPNCLSESQIPCNTILTYIHQTSFLHSSLLPLVVALQVQTEDEEQCPEPSSLTYDPSTYRTVYNLVQHREHYPFTINSNPPNEFVAIFLSHLSPTNVSPSLILRHLENLPFNAITLCTWPKGVTTPYATAVLPLVALANNSCDPNAIFFKNCYSSSAILLSSRHIKKGEEIALSYKSHWSKASLEDRKRYLKDQYCFDCGCNACAMGLGGVDDLIEIEDLDVQTVTQNEWEILMEVQDEMEEILEIMKSDREEIPKIFQRIVKCCENLSRFESRLRLGVIAGDLLRTTIMQMTTSRFTN